MASLKESGKALVSFSVRLPMDLNKWLDTMVSDKIFPSKGEAVRYFLRTAKDSNVYSR